MTYAKQTGRQALDGIQAQINELENRKQEIEDEIGCFEAADEEADKVAELRAEVEELEGLLETRRKEAKVMNEMEKLLTIEKAVGVSGEEFAKVRRGAEELFEAVVARIQKREGCDARRANYLAGQDEIGRRAYATVVEMQEREANARRGAGRIAAYI